MKPGSAGAGYASKKLRVPKWEPKWDMPGSTVVRRSCSLLPACCSTLAGCSVRPQCPAQLSSWTVAGRRAGDAVQLQRLLRHRIAEGLRLPAVRLCAHHRTQLSCHACPLLQLVLPVLAPIVWPCAAAAPMPLPLLCWHSSLPNPCCRPLGRVKQEGRLVPGQADDMQRVHRQPVCDAPRR